MCAPKRKNDVQGYYNECYVTKYRKTDENYSVSDEKKKNTDVVKQNKYTEYFYID
jgi:hypothetical protein